jgi:putative Mn2+ efflux pump MntP
VRPEDAENLFDVVSRIIFGVAAGILMLLALLLIADVLVQTVSTFLSWRGMAIAALTGIGYVVVAIAVFDVAKYLFDEEVIRAREMRAASETRRSLTRFISTIAIAVFLEALVTVFRVSQEDVAKLLYPTLLFVAAILLVVGLGVYQRLSAEVEERVGHRDRADHAKNSK